MRLIFKIILGLAVCLSEAYCSSALNLASKYAILIDLTTHTVLYEKDADVQTPPSSMSKIVTIYVVFDLIKKGHIDANNTFTISEKAWKTGGSRMFINVGSAVRIEDLLRGVIVQSGNDAAVALAEGCAGTEAGFVEMMNQKLCALGIKNSTLVNATGLPAEGHLMSVRDLALIAEHTILDYPEFYSLYSEKEFTFNKINQQNRNPLLVSFPSCDGLKTGYTEAGGYGLVASAIQNGRRLIMVINGCKTAKERAQEAERLMSWGFTYFASPRLLTAGQVLEDADVWLGKKGQVSLICEQDVYVTVPRQKQHEIQLELSYKGPVAAPIKKGQKIAEMVITVPDQAPLTYPLVAAEDVEKAGMFSRIGAAFNYLVYGNSVR